MKKLFALILTTLLSTGIFATKLSAAEEPQAKEMVKFVMAITRKEGMSHEEFRDYWENNHGAYFKKHMADMNGIKYVQNYLVDTPMNKMIQDSRGMTPAYDGVAEVWFESLEALQAGMSSPAGMKLGEYLAKDELNFIDHSKSSAFIMTEQEF